MSDYIRKVMDPLEEIRTGPYKIQISYRCRANHGWVELNMLDYFPIPVADMRSLLKICQYASHPEEIYIWEFLGAMEYLYLHTYSSSTKKRLRSNMEICRVRLNRLGYETTKQIEEYINDKL